MSHDLFVIGRLDADPSRSNDHTPRTTFAIVSQEHGAPTERFAVVATGRLADACARYLREGRLVAVRGQLRSVAHTRADGRRARLLQLHARSVEFLDRPAARSTAA